jgi:hypothetical protein
MALSQLETAALHRFHQAAFQASLRPRLIDDMLSDPILLEMARTALARMSEVIAARGPNADHVTAVTLACLADALRQVDAASPNDITIQHG